MTPTTPDQGFAQAIADRDNIIRGLLNESEALTKERDAALEQNTALDARCANLEAAGNLALEALDQSVGTYFDKRDAAIAALSQAGVQ